MAPELVSKVVSYCTFSFDKNARLTGHSPDCRERALINYVRQNAEKGNAEAVLSAIDSFTDHSWMPILGKEKSRILDDAMQTFSPGMALELGTYCGYSAIRIASKMTEPDSKLVSIEMNSHNFGIAKEMIDHAGLSSKVTVLKGTLSELDDKLEDILTEMTASHFDFIFMDHFKHCYLPDFLLLEKKGMLGKGTCIVTDSVGYPEAQNYLNYLNQHREELESQVYISKWKSLLPCKMTVSTYIHEANLVT
jgi:catechol O-methyltransferase